jgi:hypothetical protein
MTKVLLHPKPRDFNFEGYLNHFFVQKKNENFKNNPLN